MHRFPRPVHRAALGVAVLAGAMFMTAGAEAACPEGTKAYMVRGEIRCIKNGFAPSAEDQCSSLLTSVQPASEARRVYNNCIAMIVNGPDDFVTCPDGRRVAPVNSRLCSQR